MDLVGFGDDTAGYTIGMGSEHLIIFEFRLNAPSCRNTPIFCSYLITPQMRFIQSFRVPFVLEAIREPKIENFYTPDPLPFPPPPTECCPKNNNPTPTPTPPRFDTNQVPNDHFFVEMPFREGGGICVV